MHEMICKTNMGQMGIQIGVNWNGGKFGRTKLDNMVLGMTIWTLWYIICTNVYINMYLRYTEMWC